MEGYQQTSLWAYQNEIIPELGARQKVVFEALKTRPNFTNTELSKHLDFPINTITPRVGELRKKGLVDQAEIRVCKETGRRAIAWRVKA